MVVTWPVVLPPQTCCHGGNLDNSSIGDKFLDTKEKEFIDAMNSGPHRKSPSSNQNQTIKIRLRFVAPAALMVAAAASMLLGTATVYAGDKGFYLGANAGVNLAEELTSDNGNQTTSLNPGARVNLFAGYTFGLADHLTIAPELEAGFLHNSFGNGTAFGVNTSGGGNLTQVPVLVNAIVGWPVAPRFHAYAGVGVGMEYFDISAPNDSPHSAMATSAGAFVGQLRAGINYTLGPGEIGFSYEYMANSVPFYKSLGNNAIMVSYTIHF